MLKSLKLFLIALILFTGASAARAQTVVSESFTSTTDMNTSQMVWNIALSMLHPPLLISGWDSGGGAQNTSYSVGDGHDGSFDVTTYASFGAVVSNVITIDTDVYTDLQFTTFNLVSGYTLRPTGSHPLIIRSQSDVIIDGIIDCSGNSGVNAVADPTAVVQGGTGICGGGNGGASVADTFAPGAANMGSAGGAQVTGGAGGTLGSASGGAGGGGGGAYIKPFAAPPDLPDPTAGTNPVAGSGGAAGTVFRDDAFATNLAGAGSGGGGGSAAPGNSSGASGGAGGGNIQIYAVRNVTVTVNGSVFSNGGNGGNATGSFAGGGGGGGGAGSILIFAGSIITLDGPVTAIEGGGSFSNGGAGGNGAYGRTWLVDSTGGDSGTTPELPTSNLASRGTDVYETGVTYEVVSNPIDFNNSAPTLTGLPMTLVNAASAGTLDYLLAFSSQPTLSSFSPYRVSTLYLNAPVERYASFKLEVSNTSATNPIEITNLSFDLDDYTEQQFNFTTGCGQGSSQAAPAAQIKVVPAAEIKASAGAFFLPFFLFSLLRMIMIFRKRD